MPAMIGNAVAASAIALAASIMTAKHHNNSYDLNTFKSAQYCMPQYDVPDAQRNVYCASSTLL
jgi:hypothetical protein